VAKKADDLRGGEGGDQKNPKKGSDLIRKTQKHKVASVSLEKVKRGEEKKKMRKTEAQRKENQSN